MQQTVLILGARGRLGLACARAFADAGWRVLAHVRPGAQLAPELCRDARLHWLAHEVHDSAGLARAAGEAAGAAGVAVVVHALNPAYTDSAWKAQALPLTESALALCRALQATLMLPGNIYNFGATMPELLREDTPQAAHTVKGRIRIGMEEQIRRSGVRSIVIRAGDFFGAGRGTWFDQAIVQDIHKGVFSYPGAMDVATAWAYLPDLARTFVAVAQQRAGLKAFEVLHFAGHSITARGWLQVLTPVARAQGWINSGEVLRYKRLPWAFIRLGGVLRPTWASLAEMRYLWERPHQLDNSRLLTLLGAEPHTPLEQAAAAALAELGHRASPAPVSSSGRHAQEAWQPQRE